MKVRGIAANAAFAGTGDLASKMSALMVILIAARLLPVPEFAVVATALACAGILATFLDLGAGTLLTRDGTEGEESRGALFRALLLVRVPLVVVVLAMAIPFGFSIGRPVTALTVVALAASGALALSTLGLYRSCQDVRPEAIQKIAAAMLSILLVLLCGFFARSADVLLVALACASLVALLPLLVRTPAIARFERTVTPLSALRRAAPLGVLALATVFYYRSGTLALAILTDAQQTAAFGLAASLAFGLLMLPNAITTALLPRLSAVTDPSDLTACARRALAWTLALALPISLAAAVAGPIVLPLVVGTAYARAALPLALLCAGIPIIATSGVIGTALLAVQRVRELAQQVSASLLVNVAALALLVPSLGAVGASVATLTCETAGLLLLVRAARRALPGLTALPARHPINESALPAPRFRRRGTHASAAELPSSTQAVPQPRYSHRA